MACTVYPSILTENSTVDGKNPAPPGCIKNPLKNRIFSISND